MRACRKNNEAVVKEIKMESTVAICMSCDVPTSKNKWSELLSVLLCKLAIFLKSIHLRTANYNGDSSSVDCGWSYTALNSWQLTEATSVKDCTMRRELFVEVTLLHFILGMNSTMHLILPTDKCTYTEVYIIRVNLSIKILEILRFHTSCTRIHLSNMKEDDGRKRVSTKLSSSKWKDSEPSKLKYGQSRCWWWLRAITVIAILMEIPYFLILN